MESRIVFFDLETGGLGPKHPDIQLAAVAANRFEPVESFEAKIEFCEEDCEPGALRVNSYDAKTWEREAKPESVVVSEFRAFLRRHAVIDMVSQRGNSYRIARLCGHNAASFDAPRLQAMFRRHDAFLPASYKVLDTLQLALWIGDFDSHKLSDLCASCGIKTDGAHDALADVRMTVKLAKHLHSMTGGNG